MYNWFNYSRLKRQFENQLKENAELREENKNLEDILNSIAEDGTIEHNNAIRLRQENAKLNLRITELTKEVIGLRHLKSENVELIEKLGKETQKHPMYPLHWGGYQQENILKDLPKSFPDEFKEETTAENLEERFDAGKDVLGYFNKPYMPPWKCRCKVCQESKRKK